LANLAGKSFEVQTADDNRWVTDTVCQERTEALERAEMLLDTGNCDAVKVIAESERGGSEVIFQQTAAKRKKKITVVAITEAAMCEKLPDYYSFEARRTTGRVLRNFLDEHVITALELAFSANHLTILERQDTLLIQAVQRVAGIQAREAGVDPAKRVDAIERVVNEIKDRAKDAAREDKYFKLLKSKGLKATVAEAAKLSGDGAQDFAVHGALARYLGESADWNAKLLALSGLGRKDLGDAATRYLDEAAAEILDGATAIMELLGSPSDAATADGMMIHLSGGRCKAPKNSLSPIEEVNEMMARLDLPLSRQVLLDRVASQLGGTQPLTREGKGADRAAFVTLVRDLVGDDGLIGGAAICEAVTLRARIVLSEEDSDLSLEEGAGRILDMIPHRLARFGYVVDLANSRLPDSNPDMFADALAHLVGHLTAAASFIPRGAGSDTVKKSAAAITERLASAAMSAELKKSVDQGLDKMINKKGAASDGAPPDRFKLDDGSKKMANNGQDRKTFETGDMIFEEGDGGEEAYLVVAGSVEIFRKAGNNEKVLATLGRGDIFGEISLIDHQPRMASARSLEETQLTIINKETLRQRLDRLEETDRVLRRLIDILADRLRGLGRVAE